MKKSFKWIGFLFLFITSIVVLPLAFSQDTLGSHGNKKTLICGWYSWYPYQYEETVNKAEVLTGLDINLITEIFREAGYKVKYDHVDWRAHQQDIAEGRRDIAGGAFYSKDRAQYAYYSEPYRNEADVLFVRKGEVKKIKFKNIKEMVVAFHNKKSKIGIVKGYKYASDELNDLISDPKYKDLFIPVGTEVENFENLFSRKIDAFFIDQLVGAAIAWRYKWSNKIEQHPGFYAKKDIYVIFSKKTTTPELVNEFNRSLDRLKRNGDYQKIVADYVYPVLLALTVQKPWFFTIELIGIVAFALSGIILAHREKYSIVGAAVLATLPAAGGGLFRDLILGRYPVTFLGDQDYAITIGLVLIISYMVIRISKWLGKHSTMIAHLYLSERHQKFGDYSVAVLDSLGLSAFTISGVVITVTSKVHPMMLWGPIFAVITSISGGVIRDMIRNVPTIPFLKGALYAEISALWGFALCAYLSWKIYDLDPRATFFAVLITLLGCFACRLSVIFYKKKISFDF